LIASANGHDNVVKILLKHSADVTLKDEVIVFLNLSLSNIDIIFK